jgi:hypothetical protein
MHVTSKRVITILQAIAEQEEAKAEGQGEEQAKEQIDTGALVG